MQNEQEAQNPNSIRLNEDYEVRLEGARAIIVNHWTGAEVSFDYTYIPKVTDALMKLYAKYVKVSE